MIFAFLLLAAAVQPAVPDLPASRQEYERQAASGNRRAQTVAAELALGKGDTGTAFRWFSAAAQKGETYAQVRLGDLYLNGRGTVRNPAQAAHWYALAVGESSEAQWKLGILFQQGDGVPQSLDIAASMYRRAAEGGLADAQNSLASMYLAGLGVKQDSKEAIKWFRKAAQQNCADAQLNLASIYYHGIGVKQDLQAARDWALKARAAKTRQSEELLAAIEEAKAGRSN